MKKLILVIVFLLLSATIFAQRFSQYNTGTLYDSFENPSQRVFTPDTSQMFAFNYLVPNLNFNFYLTGDAQAALKSRAFSNYYNTAALQVGNGKFNHFDFSSNAYLVMFKLYASLNGDQELGFSINTKTEARGLVSDETVNLFNGPSVFPGNNYTNVLNDNFHYQVYQQIGFTYREQVTKHFAFGLKFSALSGSFYNEVNITQSQLNFDKANDAATLQLAGKNYISNNDGKSYLQTLIPTFRNPGASISLGGTYVTEDGFKLQGNIKDLGFIHWAKNSSLYLLNNFGRPVTINDLSGPHREDSIYNKVHFISNTNQKITDFATPTNGLAEISVNKSYWLDYNKQFKFSPTLIASKELFYTGFTAALVAPVQYQQFVISLTSSYSDMKLFNLGGQFMIKKDAFEFFVGSETLYQTASLAAAAIRKAEAPVQSYAVPSSFSGASLFFGIGWKFGPVIEHDMNSSTVPINQEKGFIGRLWDRIFPKDAVRNN